MDWFASVPQRQKTKQNFFRSRTWKCFLTTCPFPAAQPESGEWIQDVLSYLNERPKGWMTQLLPSEIPQDQVSVVTHRMTTFTNPSLVYLRFRIGTSLTPGNFQPYFLQSERRWASSWHVHLLVKRWVGPQPKVYCSSDLLLTRAQKAEGTATGSLVVGRSSSAAELGWHHTCWKMLWACSSEPWYRIRQRAVVPLEQILLFIWWKDLSDLQQSICSLPGESPDTFTGIVGLQWLGVVSQQEQVRLTVTPSPSARNDWGAIQLWTWWSHHQLCSSIHGQENQGIRGQRKWVVQLSLGLLGEEE